MSDSLAIAREGPVLTGSKVRLRPFSAEDIDAAYLGWLNDAETTRWSNQRFARHDRASCAAYLASFTGTANLFLSVRDAGDDRAVGTITAYRNLNHNSADMGILIGDRSAWGRGYGQDAWNALLEWLLAEGVRKISCGTLAVNKPMTRIAEQSGMSPDGVRRAQELVDGQAVDILHFARFGAQAR